MGVTVNYKFPTYEKTDAPDLTGAYNTAVSMIDQHIKSNETAASNADRDASKAQSDVDALETRVAKLEQQIGGFSPNPSDTVLTVSQLAKAKISKNGIVYFVEEE